MISEASPAQFRPSAALPALAVVALAAAGVWWGCLVLLPPLTGMDMPIGRLTFALKCIAVAGLLTLLAGVEAVAHERLVSPAFDPLAGQESQRLKINLRYLQNTLEQFTLFAPALLVLSVYCPNGSSMRSVVATTIVWTLTRYVFWVGYHIGSQHRVAGLVGQAQTMLVLLYVSGRFGYEIGGVLGAATLLGLYGLTEMLIVIGLLRRRASAKG